MMDDIMGEFSLVAAKHVERAGRKLRQAFYREFDASNATDTSKDPTDPTQPPTTLFAANTSPKN